jgi:hypothetical protein
MCRGLYRGRGAALGRSESASRRDHDRAEGKGLPGASRHAQNFGLRRRLRDNPSGGRLSRLSRRRPGDEPGARGIDGAPDTELTGRGYVGLGGFGDKTASFTC